ncbi:MAG: hypothetical protein L0215_14855 [Gemmataceae bacterium]|nr:hypothetical protein [Gemmataceae bacterium]
MFGLSLALWLKPNSEKPGEPGWAEVVLARNPPSTAGLDAARKPGEPGWVVAFWHAAMETSFV